MFYVFVILSISNYVGINTGKGEGDFKPDLIHHGFPFYALMVKRSVDLTKGPWSTILFADFETGIPSGWHVFDENGDGATWTTGTTEDLSSYEPPDFGTAYAYYSDDDASSSAPPGDEKLRTPSLCISEFDSLVLIYSVGFNFRSFNSSGQVWARFFKDNLWQNWNILVIYTSDTSLVDTLDLSSFLPAESIQVNFVWVESTKTWDWAYGVDNVQLLGFTEGGMYDAAVSDLLSPPQYFSPINYPVIARIKNTGDSTFTFGVHAEITDTGGTSILFEKDTIVYSLPSDSILDMNFGDCTISQLDPHVLKYTVTITTQDSTPGNNSLTEVIKLDIELKADSIISPPEVVSKDEVYPVIVKYHSDTADADSWTYTSWFHTEMLDDSFVCDTTIQITPGNFYDINFGNWSSSNYGIFTLLSYSIQPDDINPLNDTISKTIICTNWHMFSDSLPHPDMDHAVVTNGNVIYLLGGYDGFTSHSELYIYNMDAGTWTTGAPIPVDICMFDAALIGDTIYIPGGYSYSLDSILDTLFKYSISGNNWSSSPGTGEAVWFYGCEAVNGKLYKFGGYNNTTGTAYKSTWEYDPTTGTWTKRSDIPYPVELMAHWSLNDTIFIGGGYDGTNPIDSTAFYVISTNTWICNTSDFAKLPQKIWGSASIVYKDTFYILGGCDETYTPLDYGYFYDALSNTWIKTGKMPYAVFRGDGGSITGFGGIDGLYYLGGSTYGFNPTDSIQTTSQAYTYLDNPGPSIKFISSIGKNIKFSVNGSVDVSIYIYDISGRVIKEYSKVRPGNYIIGSLPPGIYFIKLNQGKLTERHKFIVIK